MTADPFAGGPARAGAAIEARILGGPGRDNALYVRIDLGQRVVRYLFDCGEGCLDEIPVGEVGRIDAIFFSHLHVDHIAGFDRFLRINYSREGPPVPLFGPAGSAGILHHRLQGIQWDRVEGIPGAFSLTEVRRDSLQTFEARTGEAFRILRAGPEAPSSGTVLDDGEVAVDAAVLDHGTPCLGYRVRRKPRRGVLPERLQASGLKPGQWLRDVKDEKVGGDREVAVAGRTFRIADLRAMLLEERPGESLGYLTDFRLAPGTSEDLARTFGGCDVLICENNYRDADAELARANFHMISSEVGALAGLLAPGRLLLFHLSDRYPPEGWLDLLREVRALYPETYFPAEWRGLAPGEGS